MALYTCRRHNEYAIGQTDGLPGLLKGVLLPPVLHPPALAAHAQVRRWGAKVREDIRRRKSISFVHCPNGGGEVQPESKSVEVVWSLLDNVQKKDVFFYVFPEYHGFLTYCGFYDCVLASVPVE